MRDVGAGRSGQRFGVRACLVGGASCNDDFEVCLAPQSLSGARAKSAVAADDEDARHGAVPTALGVRLAAGFGGSGYGRSRGRLGGSVRAD